MSSQDARVAQLEAKVAQLEAQLRQQQSGRGPWQQQQQQQSDHQGWAPWQQQQRQQQLQLQQSDAFGRGEQTMASRSLRASAPQTRPRSPTSVTSPASPFANSPLLPFEVRNVRQSSGYK